MPWCTPCDRFLSPSSVRADGSCPSCGGVVDPGWARAVTVDGATPYETNGEDEAAPLPWHFKLLVGAVALYLGYRAFQGIEWVVTLL